MNLPPLIIKDCLLLAVGPKPAMNWKELKHFLEKKKEEKKGHNAPKDYLMVLS